MSYLKHTIFLMIILVKGSLFGSFQEMHMKQEEKPFVILIASYNNEKYAQDNIVSALIQRYSNYRIIFINDCSSDRTLDIVKETVQKYDAVNRVTIIDNRERKLGLRNYYEAIIEHTRDEEIVINLDGDDFLANKNVLSILNKIYRNPRKEVWLTYGQFITLRGRMAGWNIEIPQSVVEKNDFRNFPDMPTHLRTFYSWLFKKINIKDLLYDGRFFEMAWDYAFMLPMLEMCREKFQFVDRALYIYNDSNPINDYKVNKGLQDYYARYIREMPKYKPLKHNVFQQCQDLGCIICNEEIKDKIYESFN